MAFKRPVFDTVPKIHAALKQHSILDDQMQAADALMKMAITHEVRAVFVAGGIVAPLVVLLSDGKMRERAARCLRTLADVQPSRTIMVTEGAVAPLVKCLCPIDFPENEEAAGAIANLAATDGIRDAIVAAGAIPHLVALLSGTSARARARAASALGALAGSDTCGDAVVNAGALLPMVQMLSADVEEERNEGARSLGRIAGSNKRRTLVVRAGALQPLVVILAPGGTDDSRICAARAIAAISLLGDEEMPELITDLLPPPEADVFIEAGVVRPLVELLTNGNAESKESAAEAILNLSDRLEIHDVLLSAHALRPLIEVVGRGQSATSRAWAAGTLRRLVAATPEHRDLIEAAVPRGQRGREQIIQTLQLYCF